MSSHDLDTTACISSDVLADDNGADSTCAKAEENTNALSKFRESAGRETLKEKPLNLLVIGT